MAVNRKQDLRIRNLGVQKQNRIPFLTGTPGPSTGRDGDMQMRLVPRKGLYLFYKHGNEWYGTKMDKFIKQVRDKNRFIVPNFAAGKGHHKLEEGELIWNGENIGIYHGKTKGLVEINKKGDKDYLISGGSITDTNVDVSSKTLVLSPAQKEDIAGNFSYSDLVNVGATANADFSIGIYEIHAGRIKLSQPADAEGILGYNNGIFELQDGTSKQNAMVHDPTTGLVKRTRNTGSSDIIFDTNNFTIQDADVTTIETKFTIGHLVGGAKTSVKLWEDTVKVQTSAPTTAAEFQNHPMVYETTNKYLYVKVGDKVVKELMSDALDFTYDVLTFGFNPAVDATQEIGGGDTPVSGSAPDGYWKAAGDLGFGLTYQNGPPTNVTITAALSAGSTGWTADAVTVAGSGSTSQTVDSAQNLNYPTAVNGTATFSVTSSPAPDDGTYPSNKVVTFKNAVKHGSNSSTTVADATLNTLSTKFLDDISTRTIAGVSTGSGQYLYYAFPTRLTRLNGEYNFRHQGMTAGFTETTYNHTNLLGFKENYYAYVQQKANVSSGTLLTNTSQGLLNQMFWGTHGDNTITNTDLNTIDASPTISDDTTRDLGSITTSAGERLVFSYDADHSDLGVDGSSNCNAFWVDGYTAGFTQQTTSNYQNPAGRTANYKSYTSNVTNITGGASKAWRSDKSGSTVLQRKWGFITGVSDPASFSSANFKALTDASYNKDSTNNDSTTWGTKTCPTNARLVLCIPSGEADINIDEGSGTSNDVKFGGVSCGFEKASSQSLENDFGYTTTYDVYISKRTNMNRNNSGALSILSSNADNNEHIWGVHTESAASITELTSDELYALTEGGSDDTEGNHDNHRVIQSSMDIGTNEFITYAHRAAHTDLTIGKFRFNGITMGMTKLSSTVAYKNRNGFTENFDVYVSDTPKLSQYQGAGDFEYNSDAAVKNHTYWGKVNLGSTWNNTKDLSTDLVTLEEDGTVSNALNTTDMNKLLINNYPTNADYGSITTDSTNWFVFGHRDAGNSTLVATQFQLQADPGNTASRITMGMIKNPSNAIYEHTNNSGFKEDYEVWVATNYAYNQESEWKFYLSASSTVKNQYFYGWKLDSASTPATVTESDLNTGEGISVAYDGGANVDTLSSTSIAATTNKRIVFAAADARIEDKDSDYFRFKGYTVAMTKQDLDNFENVAGYKENYDVWISDKKSLSSGNFEVLASGDRLNQVRISSGASATPTLNQSFIDGLTDVIDVTYNNDVTYNILESTTSGDIVSEWELTGLTNGHYIYLAMPRRHGMNIGSNAESFQWKPTAGSDYGSSCGHAGFTCLTTGGAVSWENYNGLIEDYDVFVSKSVVGSKLGTAGYLGFNASLSDTFRQVYYGTHSTNGISDTNLETLIGVISTDSANASGTAVPMSVTAGSGEYVYFSCNSQETDLTTGTDYASVATGTSFTYDGLTMGTKAVVNHGTVEGGYGQTNAHETYQSEITNMRGGATSELKAYTGQKLINRWYYGTSSTSDVSSYNNAQLATLLSELTPVTLSNGTVLGDITTDPVTPESLFSVNALGGDDDEFIWFVYPTRYKTANSNNWFTYHIPYTLPFAGGMGGYGSYVNGEGHVGNFTNDVGWTESYIFVRSENHSLGETTVRVLA